MLMLKKELGKPNLKYVLKSLLRMDKNSKAMLQHDVYKFVLNVMSSLFSFEKSHNIAYD